MNKRHYEHTLPNIRGSLSNTYRGKAVLYTVRNKEKKEGMEHLSTGLASRLPV